MARLKPRFLSLRLPEIGRVWIGASPTPNWRGSSESPASAWANAYTFSLPDLPNSASESYSLIFKANTPGNYIVVSGVSSTGSNFGLTVAVDFVTNAFGLEGRAEALDGGYLGARCIDREFLAWFHWPVAADV